MVVFCGSEMNSRNERPFPISESFDVLMKIQRNEHIWLHKMYKEMKTIDKLKFEPMMCVRILQELTQRYPVQTQYHSNSLQDRMIGKLCELPRIETEEMVRGLGIHSILPIEQDLVNYIANRVTLTEELVSQSPKQILQFICDHRKAKIAELEQARVLSEDECV